MFRVEKALGLMYLELEGPDGDGEGVFFGDEEAEGGGGGTVGGEDVVVFWGVLASCSIMMFGVGRESLGKGCRWLMQGPFDGMQLTGRKAYIGGVV